MGKKLDLQCFVLDADITVITNRFYIAYTIIIKAINRDVQGELETQAAYTDINWVLVTYLIRQNG